MSRSSVRLVIQARPSSSMSCFHHSSTVSASAPYRASSHSLAGMSSGSTVSEAVNRVAWAMLFRETRSLRPRW